MSDTAVGYFIGWDVGGWNCDTNRKSRDAIVILNEDLALLGTPWRGNLRTTINDAETSCAWTKAVFSLCEVEEPPEFPTVSLAIDTPLAFSKPFLRLSMGHRVDDPIGNSDTNPYLFRQTELHIFRKGLSPLSAIKDMIGSQATKGMHLLAKFASIGKGIGVWTDGHGLTVIEAYPSACKSSASIKALRKKFSPLGHQDKEDALTCALVAHLFATRPDALEPPGPEVPEREGWIWVPRDAFHSVPSEEAMEARPQ